LNRIEQPMAGDRETLWIRVRRRPVAQQAALAIIGAALVLLAIYWLFLRSSGRRALQRRR